jgi:T-complex protein 1 subunit gamma
MKTAVESAQMLLRIDDIVSGISRKQATASGPARGAEIEDPDAVDPEQQLPE